MIIIENGILEKVYEKITETRSTSSLCDMSTTTRSMCLDQRSEEYLNEFDEVRESRIYRVTEDLLMQCTDVTNWDFKDFYLIVADERGKYYENDLYRHFRVSESKEGAFKIAKAYLHFNGDGEKTVDCKGDKDFEDLKKKFWFKTEKSTVKVRLTYVTGSEDEQQVLDVLAQNFDILKVSKEYPGRDGSKYSNIYVDVEIEK